MCHVHDSMLIGTTLLLKIFFIHLKNSFIFLNIKLLKYLVKLIQFLYFLY